MLEILEAHFLFQPEQLILEMRRRGCPGRIKLRDGTYIALEWHAAEAVNDPMYRIQGVGINGQSNSR